MNFNSSQSSDPDPGDTLTYAWDLDDDGQLDDSNSPSPSFTYNYRRLYTVTLRVTDTSGVFDEDTVTINAGGGGPPTPDHQHAGGRHDLGRGPVDRVHRLRHRPRGRHAAGRALDWQLIMHHCTSPGNCHEHGIQSFENTAGGTFVAPDHEYPSHLELKLTATDSSNKTATVSRELTSHRQCHRRQRSAGLERVPGLRERRRAGHRDVHRGLREHAQRTVSAGQRQHDLGLLVLVRRPGADPHVAPDVSTTYTARFTPRTPGTSTLTFNPAADAPST